MENDDAQGSDWTGSSNQSSPDKNSPSPTDVNQSHEIGSKRKADSDEDAGSDAKIPKENASDTEPEFESNEKNTHSNSDKELDEDDLELIAENTGQEYAPRSGALKRLKRMKSPSSSAASSQPPSAGPRSSNLANLFDDEIDVSDHEEGEETGSSEQDVEEEKPGSTAQPVSTYDYRTEQRFLRDEDEDDLDDFIVDDEDEADPSVPRPRQRQAIPARPRASGHQSAADLGISKDAWDEVNDLFGDGSEYAHAMYVEEDHGDDEEQSQKQKRVEDIYEPAEIEEKMFTKRDEVIREQDIPERYQLTGLPISEPDFEEIKSEALWIARHLNQSRRSRDEVTENSPIVNALKLLIQFIRVDSLEVPFIQRHRQDYFVSVMDGRELWEIYDLNNKWIRLNHRKQQLRQWSAALPDLDYLLIKSDSDEAMEDLNDLLQARYRKEMEDWKDNEANGNANGTDVAKFKRPVKQDLYGTAKRNGLKDFTKLFGISVQEFSVNFSENYRQYNAEDHEIEPKLLAENYRTNELTTAEAVLAAARHMIATEMATDLQIRSAFREIVQRTSTVSTTPTDRGMLEIDEQHEFYNFKFLKHKPADAFQDGQFMQIIEAQKCGLLNLQIEINLFDIKRAYESFYLSDNYSIVAERWNEERRKILKQAFEQILVPLMQSWLKEQLLNRATEFVSREIQRNFESIVRQGPYKTHDEQLPRVLAVSCGGGDDRVASFAALLNSTGQLVDHLKLNSIHSRNPQLRAGDITKLREFVQRYDTPDVVAISGWSLETRNLFDTVRQALPDIDVIYARDDVARIYQHSERGKTEFPAFSPILKYCICLGRCLQEPLAEYSTLFNPKQEALFVRLHPLQNYLPKEKLYASLERCMINTINEVGLDINRLINSAALPYCLQFVSGLGPRKADSLISRIQGSGGVLENRSDLIRNCRIGKIVFMNCASFIRINPDSFPKRRATGDTDVLDNTRVHPEDYALARKMAADALEIVEVNDDENPSQHVEEVMEDPHVLDPLILEEYAKELLTSHGPKRLTLEMIRQELKRPYHDPRFQHQKPSEEEIFCMLTGETEKSLRPGLVITGVVARVKSNLVVVRLDSGLEGLVAIKNLSDAPIQSPQQVAQEGEALRCKVLDVNKARFTVELSARRSALNYECILDQFFDTQAEEVAKSKLKDFSKLKKPQIRSIKHPQFRNIGFREAEKYLSNRPQGDLVFRPSSRKSHLVVTWKVAEGVYQHVEIEELQKDNEYLLGKQLQINNQTFPDLDAVAVLFVEPMARCVRELLAFPKFLQGSKSDLYAHVEREMMANPKKIPYVIGMGDSPGRFYLVYKLGLERRTEHETITVIPDGYRFRKVNYPRLINLLNSFKQNPILATPQRMMPPPRQPMPPPPPSYGYPHMPPLPRPMPMQAAPFGRYPPPMYGMPPPPQHQYPPYRR